MSMRLRRGATTRGLRRWMGNPKLASTPLLFPITIELSNEEFMILKENMDILRELKFDIEEFGVNSVIVKEHPAWIPGDMGRRGYSKDNRNCNSYTKEVRYRKV